MQCPPALRLSITVLTLALLALGPAAHARSNTQWPIPAHGVLGLAAEHLEATYWIDKLGPAAERPWRSAEQIARQNAALVRDEDSMRDVADIGRTLHGETVAAWIRALSRTPDAPRYDRTGRQLPPGFFRTLETNLALDAIAPTQPTGFGLVVRRADLRAFPDDTPVFSRAGETNIDRFQESALFPGDAVAVAHASADGDWLFVISDRYMAWIARDAVAIGDYATVMGYHADGPALTVTGATVRTVHTPERPELSELQLDMGVRVPLYPDWPADQPVNGQHPAFGHVVQLPVRQADGSLQLAPALVPRSADVAPAPLALTPANTLRQAFKFLGERYGWGHMFNARDCSGFLSEIFRSMGVQIPRNTSRQSVSPALDKTLFDAQTPHHERLAAIAALEVGDLVFVPGHVMMVIGRDNGLTYVIHDTAGINYLRDGALVRMDLQGVAVTPLEPLMSNAQDSTIDRITSIVRLR